MKKKLRKYRKLIAAAAGALSVAASQGLIVGTAAKVVAIGIGFLTAAGVYVVPNE